MLPDNPQPRLIRPTFLKKIATLLLGWLLILDVTLTASTLGDERFTIERNAAFSGFDGRTCWVHARAGIIPAESIDADAKQPMVVMTMQKLLLSGSDVFYELHSTNSADGGKTWAQPQSQSQFARQTVSANAADQLPTGAAIAPYLLRPGDETTVCDFAPQWHAASQRLLGVGQTVWYRDNHVMHTRPRGIAYSVYDSQAGKWGKWDVVKIPDEPKFESAGAGSLQRVDLPGGDVLVPIYFKAVTQKQYSVAVCRCRFDGKTLAYVTHGNELTVPIDRGLYEPSLTQFRGRYYLTMRNDQHGYVCSSRDGLHFDAPRRWTFDDGNELGNYNTQQHWVTHSDGLFLVYTRRGLQNDHVFRHRAPLMIAEVDPQRLQVLRETEQVLIPERGARLGNFGIVDVSESETWVTAAEWMQPSGVESRGSDNTIFVVKLKWHQPNRRFNSLSNTPLPQSPASSPAQEAWPMINSYFTPPMVWKRQFGDYRSPLAFADGRQAQSAADWQLRRAEILSEWQDLLGRWPPLITEPNVEVLATESREDFTQHQIRFQWTPHEQTTGYLLIPDGRGPFPAVISVYYEPETAIGLGKPYRDFALQLARRGFVTLSLGTTEATAARTYALYYPSLEEAQVAPLSMLGYAAANAWYVLASRPEVDTKKIGIVGHSFGGKWAMFAACLFDKFACAAWSDPGIVFDETRASVNYWEPWYLGYHPPPWRPRGRISSDNPARGLYPQLTAAKRDLHELHALMAPRPFLVSGGSEDRPRRWQALNHSIAVNELLGEEHRVAMTNRPDHAPNPDSNAILYAFFQHFLRP